MANPSPFPTVIKLAKEVGAEWEGYALAAEGTRNAVVLLRAALQNAPESARLLSDDTSLVLFGSFARHEMTEKKSDYDWSLLIDGVVNNSHAKLSRVIRKALDDADLPQPGSSGTFGDMIFSHDLVHRIGGEADSNINLTRRMLMLLESKPIKLSDADSSEGVWDNVLSNILERYFEEDVHFAPGRDLQVPRFLLNDMTRYWRTIAVDYAQKHRDQDGKKWAMRNAKLRLSRKLIYASGLAFCLSCQLDPPQSTHNDLFGPRSDCSARPFIERAKRFSSTPALQYLAAFVDDFTQGSEHREMIIRCIFGAYDQWLLLVNEADKRNVLNSLSHADAAENPDFQRVRELGSEFARGLELLFFEYDRKNDKQCGDVASLCLRYIGF